MQVHTCADWGQRRLCERAPRDLLVRSLRSEGKSDQGYNLVGDAVQGIKLHSAIRHVPCEWKALELARTSIAAMEETGFASWYDWSLARWGVKWDASNTAILEDTPECLDVRFDTPWSPPFPVLQAICDRFPNTDLRGWHLDEMPNFACVTGSEAGESTFLDSDVDISSRSRFTAFFREMHGIDPEVFDDDLDYDPDIEDGASPTGMN